jgi:hypothetical protein
MENTKSTFSILHSYQQLIIHANYGLKMHQRCKILVINNRYNPFSAPKGRNYIVSVIYQYCAPLGLEILRGRFYYQYHAPLGLTNP